jgi:hypothetical protein
MPQLAAEINNMLKDLHTTEEAAPMVRLTKRALEYLRCQGRGPGYLKLGRRVFYTTEGLERWAASRQVETAESQSAPMAARSDER